MTTQVEQTRDLIEKIKAGELSDCYAPYYFSALPLDQETRAARAYMGSLSAAQKLHEALLPSNCYWWVERRPDGLNQSGVTVGDLGKTFQATAETPARAWLIAILSAYAAQETDQ